MSVLLLLALAVACVDDDPAKLLAKKDVADRLRGLELLASDGHKAAERLLKKAVNDGDFEVQWRAVQALATHGTGNSTKMLVEVATDHPLRVVRRAAAESLRAIDPAEAAKKLAGKLKGRSKTAAAEALAIVGDSSSRKVFEKLAKETDPTLQAYALLGLGRAGGLDDADVLEAIEEPLGSTNTRRAAGAARALAATGDARALEPLLARLVKGRISDVLARRLIDAIAAVREAGDVSARAALDERVVVALDGAESASAIAWLTRLLARLGATSSASAIVKKGLSSSDVAVRSAAVAALGTLGGDESFDGVREALKNDGTARVRFHAIRALATIDAEKAKPAITAALDDADATVREEAAVVCGTRHWKDAAEALRPKLGDADWRVALAAAVSLGSIQDEDSIAPLQEMLKTGGDWRQRATALTGLGRIGRRECIPLLIEALDDPDPMVKAVARDYLKRLCLADLPADPAPWRKWWEGNEKKFSFQDRNRRYADVQDEKYAYGDFKRRPYGALQDIDVIVLGGGNDGIEKYLAAATIAHRMTGKGDVKESGLNPNAVFIANCPGELAGEDPDRIEWFVHSGGYVFATCWGLTRTIARIFPGIIHAERMEADRSSVDAEPTDRKSPLLEHVVAPFTELHYNIAGYQLIVVDDPERFEVLIDSESADAQWGQGNLFGWFRAGHGVVADSTNHFTLQGMGNERFDSEADRMAFAFERLGYDFERLRELREDGVFKKDRSAAAAVDDQSFLRLMARFVHLRRRVDG